MEEVMDVVSASSEDERTSGSIIKVRVRAVEGIGPITDTLRSTLASATTDKLMQEPTAASFPFISATEFNAVCKTFEDLFNKHDYTQDAGDPVVFIEHDDGNGCLRITKTLGQGNEEAASASAPSLSRHDLIRDFDESDDEALVPVPKILNDIVIEYNIILSPSYQVPVLYFFIRGISCTIETLYQHIVPRHFKGQVQHVGVMGGISMTSHPVTGAPTFFVHPCNTAEALKSIAPSADVKLDEYMLLWFGIVGASVGLNVPSTLAKAIGGAASGSSVPQSA